ncbi:hypothetical protein CRUP_001903, partial [Coryphaenoides rupestris]
MQGPAGPPGTKGELRAPGQAPGRAEGCMAAGSPGELRAPGQAPGRAEGCGAPEPQQRGSGQQRGPLQKADQAQRRLEVVGLQQLHQHGEDQRADEALRQAEHHRVEHQRRERCPRAAEGVAQPVDHHHAAQHVGGAATAAAAAAPPPQTRQPQQEAGGRPRGQTHQADDGQEEGG